MSAKGIKDKLYDFLGVGEDTEPYVDGEDDDYPAPQPGPQAGPRHAGTQTRPVAGLTTAPNNRGNIHPLPTAAGHEVVVIEPKSFDEALAILDNLRSRKAVILNLIGLTPDQSQRLVDFVSGACHALDGHQEKIGESIFLFTPANVLINSFHSEREWASTQAPKDLFFKVR